MKIIRLKGGLGNQMFQYCFALKVQEKTDDIVKLDYSFFDQKDLGRVKKPRIKQFCLQLGDASQNEIHSICKLNHAIKNRIVYYISIFIEKIINRRYYFEFSLVHKKELNFNRYHYFDGYWQSWSLVESVFPLLREHFVPSSLDKKTIDMISFVESCNSVFVGVRKGDYSSASHRYGGFGQDYYLKAMSYLENIIDNPVYIIFSDDIEWVKANIDFGKRNVVYRNNNDVVSDFDELQIMMKCKHSIIINSTYHWWGARFFDREGKVVIAPKTWFFDNKKIDIIPPNWITI